MVLLLLWLLLIRDGVVDLDVAVGDSGLLILLFLLVLAVVTLLLLVLFLL